MLGKPRLPLPKKSVLPAGFRAKHFVLGSVPFAPRAEYLRVAARNRAPRVLFWVLVVTVPFLFGLAVLNFGPSIHETPSVVAGKTATLHIVNCLMVVASFWATLAKAMRRPVPRWDFF